MPESIASATPQPTHLRVLRRVVNLILMNAVFFAGAALLVASDWYQRNYFTELPGWLPTILWIAALVLLVNWFFLMLLSSDLNEQAESESQ